MENFALDVFVVGAGSGGLAAAKRAAGHGARVAIAEGSRVGGTCVIRGCVPKKLMVYAAQLGDSRQLAADFGWAEAAPGFSWERLCRVRNQVVNNLELAHARHLAQAKVELIAGHATLVGPHEVRVNDRVLTARHILVATGATPVTPEFSGKELCLCSDDLFTLDARPASLVLVGGGYIAVEFACLMAGLGCKTTLVARSQVLREFDQDLRAGMVESMRQRGIDVWENSRVQGIDKDKSGLVSVHIAHAEGEASVVAETAILHAIGRRPNTAGLGLEALGVQLDASGAIVADAHHATCVPSIHALGDVINRMNLTPVAIKAGRLWADRLFAEATNTLSYANVPTAVFGSPPIGAVGLTEQEAHRQLGERAKVFKTRFIPLLYSGTPQERKNASIMKLVVDGRDDRVVGCHMLGEDAPEIIQGFAAAMSAGITKAQLDATVALHPTQAEEFVLMR